MRLLILFILFPSFGIAQISNKKVTIENHLEILNPDSAGVALFTTSSGKNAIGIKSYIQNNEGGQTLKAIEAIVNQSSFGANTSYGAFIETQGTFPTGIYAKAITTYTGSSYGAKIISEAYNAGDAYGLQVTSNSSGGNLSSGAYGGHFTSNDDSNSVGIYSQAKGLNGIGTATIGGNFISTGSEGIGVQGLATSISNLETIGGKFISSSQKGKGIVASASGGSGNEEHYGGYIEASGNRGIGLYINSDSLGQKIDANGPSGIQIGLTGFNQTGTVKAFEAKANLSSLSPNIVYGGHFDVSGQSATGIYAKAESIYNGNTIGGNFESNSVASSKGIKASANSSSLNHSTIGGEFDAGSRIGTGVYGLASYEGSSHSGNIANNKGGHFISEGNAGYGVYGLANNDDDTNTSFNYGGYFLSKGEKGIGVHGEATNSQTSEITYGGSFTSSSVNGSGILASGIQYGVHSKGDILIDQRISTGNASLILSVGTPGKVLQLIDGTNDILLGDIDNIAGDLSLYTGGNERVRITNDGKIGIGTTIPDANLHVIGESNFEGLTTISNSTEPELIFERSSPGAYDAKIRVGTTGHMYFEGGADITSDLITNMTLRSNGRLGIGTTNPDRVFHVMGEAKIEAIVADANLYMQNADGVEIRTITFQNGTQDMYFGDIDGTGGDVYLRTNGNDAIVFGSSGNIAVKNGHFYTETSSNSIGTSTSRWNTAWLTNGVNNSSDLRLKKNIENLRYGLESIKRLRPVSYEWKENSVGTKLGLIAQEIVKIIPEVVHVPENPEEFLSVDYTELIPVLINAIKEQQETIEQQKMEMKEINERLSTFESEFSALKSEMLKNN